MLHIVNNILFYFYHCIIVFRKKLKIRYFMKILFYFVVFKLETV